MTPLINRLVLHPSVLELRLATHPDFEQSKHILLSAAVVMPDLMNNFLPAFEEIDTGSGFVGAS
jgi:hypothetical protein